MNRKLYWPLLAVEAAALAALCFTGAIDGSPLPLVTAVPWAQIAALLRTLSLGGGVGNAVAIVLYVLICLLPLLALGLIRRRRRWAAEDAMLAALSALLFWGLYTLINPGRLAAVYGATLERVAIGLVIWGMLVGYGLLRLTRALFSGEEKHLWRAAAVVLWVLAALFVYGAFGDSLAELLAAIRSMRESNTGAGAGTLLGSEALLIVQYLVKILPNVLNVWVIAAMGKLLRPMAQAPYSAQSAEVADALARRCGVAVAVTVVSQLVMALVQLGLAGSVLKLNVALSVPLDAMAFTLVALVLVQLIRRGKALQDDNDLFV